MTAIVWYRDDLRISDHPALSRSRQDRTHRLRSFTCSTTERRAFGRLGGAARWWLAQSLRALQASLRERGASLVLRKGPAPEGHRRARPRDRRRSGLLERDRAGATPGRGRSGRRRAGARSASSTHRFPGDLLASPNQIRNKENRGLRVFTPFWRRVQALGDPPKPLPAPKTLKGVPDARQRQAGRLEARADPAGLGRRPARQLEARRGLGAGAPQGVPRRRHCRLFRRSRPARPRRHLAALAASSFRRDQSAPDLARRALCGGRAPSPVRRHRKIPQRTRLARVLPSSAVRRPRSRNAQPAALVRRLSMEARCQSLARVAARPDRLSDRRCRHARTLAHRRDAQPGADGGGVVPGQASPDRLALMASNGSGIRLSMPMPAATPRTGNGWQAPAPTPRPISASSIRSCRARSSIPTASMSGAGCRSWRNCPTSSIHQPWTATPLELASAGIELGKTYPRPIVDHKAGRERALTAYATIRGNS